MPRIFGLNVKTLLGLVLALIAGVIVLPGPWGLGWVGVLLGFGLYQQHQYLKQLSAPGQ